MLHRTPAWCCRMHPAWCVTWRQACLQDAKVCIGKEGYHASAEMVQLPQQAVFLKSASAEAPADVEEGRQASSEDCLHSSSVWQTQIAARDMQMASSGLRMACSARQ